MEARANLAKENDGHCDYVEKRCFGRLNKKVSLETEDGECSRACIMEYG